MNNDDAFLCLLTLALGAWLGSCAGASIKGIDARRCDAAYQAAHTGQDSVIVARDGCAWLLPRENHDAR